MPFNGGPPGAMGVPGADGPLPPPPMAGGGVGHRGSGGGGGVHPRDERRDSDLSDAFLSPEAYRAAQAVEFIAEHLRNDDEYVQVSTYHLFRVNAKDCNRVIPINS